MLLLLVATCGVLEPRVTRILINFRRERWGGRWMKIVWLSLAKAMANMLRLWRKWVPRGCKCFMKPEVYVHEDLILQAIAGCWLPWRIWLWMKHCSIKLYLRTIPLRMATVVFSTLGKLIMQENLWIYGILNGILNSECVCEEKVIWLHGWMNAGVEWLRLLCYLCRGSIVATTEVFRSVEGR